MAKQYRIDLIINARQAEEAAARAARAQQQVAEQARRTAQVVEASAEEIAQANERAAMRSMIGLHKLQIDTIKLNDRMVRDAERKAAAISAVEQRFLVQDYQARVRIEARRERDAERAAARQAAEFQKAAERAVSEDEKKAARLGQIEDRYLAREYRERVRHEAAKQREAEREQQKAQELAARTARQVIEAKQKEREQAVAEAQRKAQQLEQIESRYLAREYRERVRYEAAKQREQQRAFEASFVHINDLRSQAIGLKQDIDSAFNEKLVNGFTAALTASAAGAAVLVRGFDEINRAIFDSQKFVQGYREALRELIALKGGSTGSSDAIAADLDFRKRTLQTSREAIDFQVAARGIGEAFIDKDGQKRLVSQGEFEKAMASIGAIQAVRGMDPKTTGQLAGQIPMLFNRRMNSEDISREFMRFLNIFEPGGSDKDLLVSQFSRQAGLVQSGVYSPEEAAALLSAFSTTQIESPGEALRQFGRATMGGLDRARGTGIEGSVRQGEYLRSIKANDQMSAIDIGRTIVADLEKQEVAATGRGEKFNPYTYLKHHGYQNEEDIRALLAFQGLIRSGALDKTFLKEAGRVPLGDDIRQMIRDKQADPMMNTRKTQLAADAANVARGAGGEEAFRKYEQMAFEKLKAGGSNWAIGSYEEYANGSSWNPGNWVTRYLVRSEAQKMMESDRVANGLPRNTFASSINSRGLGLGSPFVVGGLRQEAMDTEAGVRAGGGTPLTDQLGALTDLARRQVVLQEQQVELMRQQMSGGPSKKAPPAFQRP